MQKAQRPKPREPKATVDGNASGDGPGLGRKRKRTPEWEREYHQIWKTVNELGAEQFTGKDKKAYDARKISERGGRVSELCMRWGPCLVLMMGTIADEA